MGLVAGTSGCLAPGRAVATPARPDGGRQRLRGPVAGPGSRRITPCSLRASWILASVITFGALLAISTFKSDSLGLGDAKVGLILGAGLGIDVERWTDRTLLSHGGGLDRYGTAFVIDQTERAAAALLFDDPAGYSVSAYALLDRILDRQTMPPLPRPNTTEWAPYLGRFSNGAELIYRAGRLSVRWKDQEHLLEAVDERLFASKDEVSVGLLEGSPTMISVNDFILIGAQPGVLLEHL